MHYVMCRRVNRHFCLDLSQVHRYWIVDASCPREQSENVDRSFVHEQSFNIEIQKSRVVRGEEVESTVIKLSA